MDLPPIEEQLTKSPQAAHKETGVGSLVNNLALPLVLGSWWTFIPSLLTIVLTFVRTRLEDSTLQAELPGYQEYSAQTHYRLIPGVW